MEPPGIGRGDALALDEFRAVFVKELGHRARGAAGDLLESVSRVLVLAAELRAAGGAGQSRTIDREPFPNEGNADPNRVGYVAHSAGVDR